MSKLDNKQLTTLAKNFLKEEENQLVDVILMTDDGNIFLQEKKSYAYAHSHGTESKQVYTFFRKSLFKDTYTPSEKARIEASEAEDKRVIDEAKVIEKKHENDVKEAAKIKEAQEKEAKEQAKKDKADNATAEKEAQDNKEFTELVENIAKMTPEDREKELSDYKDDDAKKELVDAINAKLSDSQVKDAKGATKEAEEEVKKETNPDQIPEELNKPMEDMLEDELIQLALFLGSEHSKSTLKAHKVDFVKELCTDLAAAKGIELPVKESE